MKELETLKVVIDAVIRPYKEKMNAIKKETSDAMKQVDAATQKGSKSMQDLNGPAKKVIDSIRNMNAEIRKMSNDASVEAGIKKYSDSNGGSKVEVILQGDAKKFFKAMQQEAVNYTNSHHTAPFPV